MKRMALLVTFWIACAGACVAGPFWRSSPCQGGQCSIQAEPVAPKKQQPPAAQKQSSEPASVQENRVRRGWLRFWRR